jgi:tetratricopeptide (TPR) repeat protein
VINERVAPSIRGSVRAALSPLSGDVRHLIETAAVAARALEPAEVDQLALHDAAAQALETGLLMSDGGRLGFRHALLREAAFEEIAEPRRRSLHKSWAQALVEAGHDGAEVARHLRLAGADPESVPHLVRAAADARDVAALGEAAAYLEEALAIAPDRAQEWLELGEIEAWRGRRDEAEAAFRRALGLLEEGDRLAMARGWLCKARAYHGPLCVPRTVLESAQQALKLLDDADGASEERSEAIAGCAWAEAVVGNVDEAERLLVALSAEAASDDNRRTYDAGHARAHTLMMRGQFAESYAPFIAAAHASVRAGRPDLAYGCWANAAGAAAAAGEPDRALEFIDRGMEAVADQGLQSIEIQLLAARSFVLRGVGRLDEARQAAESEHALAERVGQTELLAMASHDRGLLALSIGDYSLAAELLAGALVDGARVSRPLTRLALAEALACAGDPTRAEEQIRATVLEPLKPSDFPDALVPRLARVQGLVALARGDEADAKRRLEESIAGWERLLRRNIRAETIGSVLADLGRPVVGLVEPERELAKARRELEAIKKETQNAVVH